MSPLDRGRTPHQPPPSKSSPSSCYWQSHLRYPGLSQPPLHVPVHTPLLPRVAGQRWLPPSACLKHSSGNHARDRSIPRRPIVSSRERKPCSTGSNVELPTRCIDRRGRNSPVLAPGAGRSPHVCLECTPFD